MGMDMVFPQKGGEGLHGTSPVGKT
jgi:hypothetical protein